LQQGLGHVSVAPVNVRASPARDELTALLFTLFRYGKRFCPARQAKAICGSTLVAIFVSKSVSLYYFLLSPACVSNGPASPNNSLRSSAFLFIAPLADLTMQNNQTSLADTG